jgi:hypothetical protein
MKRILGILVIVGVCGVMVAGCGPETQSADQVQNQRQEELDKQAVMSVGMPTINNFAEKRELKQIYEMRDQSITTYSYFLDRDAHTHKLCDSIGYPIPYSTEFTSPEHIADSYQSGYAILPQADPNGLFSATAAAGTWVLCKNPNPNPPKGEPTSGPVYSEPDVIASPFPLDIK